MASSDPMKRAAERIAIDHPVQILQQPTARKAVKGTSGRPGKSVTKKTARQMLKRFGYIL